MSLSICIAKLTHDDDSSVHFWAVHSVNISNRTGDISIISSELYMALNEHISEFIAKSNNNNKERVGGKKSLRHHVSKLSKSFQLNT